MTKSAEVAEVIHSLRAAVLEPTKLVEAIKGLQAMVWESKAWEAGVSPQVARLAEDRDRVECGSMSDQRRFERPSNYALARNVEQPVVSRFHSCGSKPDVWL